MAQMRQPKLKLNSYKLFRKSYVLALAHKMKPLIKKHYAKYRLENWDKVNDPDDIDVSQIGALQQNQKEKIYNLIPTTIDQLKPFNQCKCGRVTNLSLPTLGDIIRDTTLDGSPNNLNGNINQGLERLTKGTIEREGLNPMLCNIANSQASGLPDLVQVFFRTEIQLPCAKRAEITPAPQFEHRIVINLNFLEKLFRSRIYLKYWNDNVANNREEPTPAIKLNDEISDRPDNNSPNIIDCIPTTNTVRAQRLWCPTASKFLKMVLSFFIALCIIVFLIAFVV